MSNIPIDRHAYLILCHNNFEHLQNLLRALDDDRNDIYIHVDKKVQDCPFDVINNMEIDANIFWVKRHSVNWGGSFTNSCRAFIIERSY